MPNASPPKVFLDTNIWFSAFWGSANCTKLLSAHKRGVIAVIISQQVIVEMVRNITEKIPALLSSYEHFMTENPPEVIADPRKIDSKTIKLVEKKDQPIFSSAVASKVDFFVTGNIKDFQVKKLEEETSIKIITPQQAIMLLYL